MVTKIAHFQTGARWGVSLDFVKMLTRGTSIFGFLNRSRLIKIVANRLQFRLKVENICLIICSKFRQLSGPSGLANSDGVVGQRYEKEILLDPDKY